MKNSQSWKALLFILGCLLGFGSTVEAVGVVLANIGVSRGRWDVGIYHQGTSLEYEIEVPQLSGETEKANVMLTEYGLSVGYRF